MNRVRHVLIIVLPSMLVGGLLFGFWPANADNGDPWNRGAPVPAPPAPPAPPVPPAPPATPPPGTPVVISVGGGHGKISVENVSEMVRKQLDQARDMVRDSPHIPPQVRATVLARLERVRAAVERRLARMKPSDLKDLGDEVERVSDDIEQAMDGLDEDLTKLGKELSKQFGKQWAKEWKKQWKKQAQEGETAEDASGDGEDGEDGEVAGPPPVDPEDARDAIADVRGIALQPQQRLQIQRLREQTEKQIAEAQTQLAMLSSKLEEALKNPRVSDDEVKMYVDHISATEATIRKAKILAWVGARRLLDEQQRAKIEAAARQRSRQR